MTSNGRRFYFIGLALAVFFIFCGNQIARLQDSSSASPPPVPAPAAGAQFQPQIAKGANSTLAVWSDRRTVLGRYVPSDFAGLGGETDIYAARYDAAGNLIDTTPIIISQAVYEQFYPHVAWNGESWLVVWTSRSISNPNVNNVVGVRVAPDGGILDAVPIAFSNITNSSDNPAYLDVASDGANWVVVWGKGSYQSQIRGARLSPTGTLMDTGGGGKVLHNDINFTAPGQARLTFAGNQFLLVWQIVGSGSGYDVRAQRFNNNLDPIGTPFIVNFSGSDANSPAVATDGTDFLVIWREDRFAYNEIFAARVSATGQVLDPNGIKLFGSAGDYIMPFNTSLTFEGTSYVAAYHARPLNTFGESVFATRVTPEGTASAPIPVASETGATQPAVAALAGGGAQIVWADRRLNQDADIFGARLAGNTVGTASATSLGAPRETHPRFTKTEAGNFALVYRSTISGESSIFLRRLNPNGSQIGVNETLIVSGSENITNPSVAWNGEVYLVVWELNTQIFGRRVAADGTTLGAAFAIMPGNTPDVAALGQQFLVVDTYEPTPHIRFTQAVRVDTNGTATGAPVKIGNNFDLRPRVRAFGERWLAVWESDISHDNPNSYITAAFVNSEGISSGEFAISGLFADAPDLAVAGNTALVVWMDGGNIIGRRIQADGTLLAPSSIIADTPSSLFAPKAAWDGARFVVAYGDSRDSATKPPAHIYATHVGPDGAILTPGGFPVGTSALSEEMPAVEALNGITLFAYAKFEDRAPFAAFRIRVSAPGSTRFDFDGDGRADVSVFRPDGGTWYLNRSTQGFAATQFGVATDKLAPADYDNDGKTDLAVFRDGNWYILNSSNSQLRIVQFGVSGDVPVPADYDNDGKADIAVFRQGTWYLLESATNQFRAVQFGLAGDRLVPADYDGDGKADIAVFRDGTWYLLRSQAGFTSVQFGSAADVPVASDYDGDGQWDVAVYRGGTWYMQQSTDGFRAVQFGANGDAPVAADYDGDGKTDLAVFRGGTWYALESMEGFFSVQFGASTDVPVMSVREP